MAHRLKLLGFIVILMVASLLLANVTKAFGHDLPPKLTVQCQCNCTIFTHDTRDHNDEQSFIIRVDAPTPPGGNFKVFWREGAVKDLQKDLDRGKHGSWTELTRVSNNDYLAIIDFAGWNWDPNGQYEIIFFAFDESTQKVVAWNNFRFFVLN